MRGDLHGLVRAAEDAGEHDRIGMRHQPAQLLELLVHRHAVGDGGDDPAGVRLALVLETGAGPGPRRGADRRAAEDTLLVLLQQVAGKEIQERIAARQVSCECYIQDRKGSLT